MSIEKLCPHCLREIYNKESVTECPYCHKSLGHIENLPHHLKQMTVLAGKYLVGDVIGEGGFGITYVGLDLNLELKVAIKEFYAIYKYIGYEEMICSSSTKYYEDEINRITEEYGYEDLWERLAGLGDFMDIRFSKEALR
ncbi:MAG: hypothetical protein K5894_14190 [Lachnospiraceae bacterium]|nr:hypothetical protein [Lachnospiraceae bacterium]